MVEDPDLEKDPVAAADLVVLTDPAEVADPELATDPEVDLVADPIPLEVEGVDPDILAMIPATLDQERQMTVLNFLVLWKYFVL